MGDGEMNQEKINEINKYIQEQLVKRELFEVDAVKAAYWLDDAGILKDTPKRPGKPLRDLLRDKLIRNSFQRTANYWFIQRGE
jgi:hypothetical protein